MPGWVRELSKEHTVIIFDNRGMGGSSNGTEEISVTRMAADSAGLLRVLGYPQADILGWSMGGLVAQELALHYPEKVDKLVSAGNIMCRRACGGNYPQVAKDGCKGIADPFLSAWLD